MCQQKVCIKCFESKPETEFKINSSGRISANCSLCIKIYQKEYKQANKERINAYIQARRGVIVRVKKVNNTCIVRNCPEPITIYMGITDCCKSHAFDKFNNIRI